MTEIRTAEERKQPRCIHCGELMRKEPGAPGGRACSQMVYSHYYGSWEHR